MGLLKSKSKSKKSGKRISQIIVRQRKGTFFGKEVLHKCAKSNAGRKNRKGINHVKLMPIIFIKGSCYETPLCGQVRSDKQDGDKGQGMRSRRSP